MVVLAESHFTIHTWPELNYAAVDLFVCQELKSESKFIDLLRGKFDAKELEYQKVYRE
ncbi:S-adenosylmethionine decarboxylase [Vagococcus sp. BWB3-3]|uniref:S-adenosylmethionine decarboxylase n=1 Tax=Vagococcus allomyrinae TaxID=2794353 RepID=A0A940PF48_9ENTE|nr:S-adenosylmethionine decarboxylase [Vagococcus allomyrinae]